MLTTCSSNGRRSRPPLAAKCRGRVAHRLTRGYEDGGQIIDHALVVVLQLGAGSSPKKFCRKSADSKKKRLPAEETFAFSNNAWLLFSNDSLLVSA